VAAACGLLYLYTRFKYFQGYAVAAQGRSVRAPQPSVGRAGCRVSQNHRMVGVGRDLCGSS